MSNTLGPHVYNVVVHDDNETITVPIEFDVVPDPIRVMSFNGGTLYGANMEGTYQIGCSFTPEVNTYAIKRLIATPLGQSLSLDSYDALDNTCTGTMTATETVHLQLELVGTIGNNGWVDAYGTPVDPPFSGFVQLTNSVTSNLFNVTALNSGLGFTQGNTTQFILSFQIVQEYANYLY